MASVRLRRVPAVPGIVNIPAEYKLIQLSINIIYLRLNTGIPSAPIGKDYLNDADREFELRKKKLGYKLPIMSEAEVIG